MMFEDGGGGGSNIAVRPEQLRATAHSFATHGETAKAETKALSETAHALFRSIHHPMVAGAVQSGAGALVERMAAVSLGLEHCDHGLSACAATYEKGDEASAKAADAMRAQWAE